MINLSLHDMNPKVTILGAMHILFSLAEFRATFWPRQFSDILLDGVKILGTGYSIYAVAFLSGTADLIIARYDGT